MSKEEELSKVRYHWASYIARGGINTPKKSHSIGDLEKGGLEHWTLFLRSAKIYLSKYPKDRHILEGFVPASLVRMLIGE